MACDGKGLGRLGSAELRGGTPSTGYNVLEHRQTSIQLQAGRVLGKQEAGEGGQ